MGRLREVPVQADVPHHPLQPLLHPRPDVVGFSEVEQPPPVRGPQRGQALPEGLAIARRHVRRLLVLGDRLIVDSVFREKNFQIRD